MHHKMLTQRALFCHRANTKRGTLSQHFMTMSYLLVNIFIGVKTSFFIACIGAKSVLISS